MDDVNASTLASTSTSSLGTKLDKSTELCYFTRYIILLQSNGKYNLIQGNNSYSRLPNIFVTPRAMVCKTNKAKKNELI